MIPFEHIFNLSKNKKKGVLVLLPGRGCQAKSLLDLYKNIGELQETLLIGIQPEKEWYPLPNGANDQSSAIAGLRKTVIQLRSFLQNLQKTYDFTTEETVLAGFSAGAVVALQLALTGEEEYDMVIAHNGAIFEPSEVPIASKKTTYALLHTQDDNCFTWLERYVPMKQSLMNKNHKIFTIEKPIGGHNISDNDILILSKHLKTRFGYSLFDSQVYF